MTSVLIAGITDGANALLWLYVWLLSAMAAAYLSERKGYSDRAGLATGLCLTFIGPIIWLIVPAKADSKWKTIGPFGTGQDKKRSA
jgi:hypothetical protein